MDGLNVFLIVFLGVVSRGHDWISGSELEVTVTPGDNITLYCDCKTSSGEYIVWFKNCSHEYQPSLVLRTRYVYRALYLVDTSDILNPFPHLSLVKNQSSGSYDLRIVNITQSNEGHYYCGTEQTVNTVSKESVYRYGNITTRILLNTYENVEHRGVCWTLLFSVCPAVALLSSLLSSLVVYQCCQKKAKEPQDEGERPDSRGQIREKLDEDVCYTALEIRQAPKRPKKKKTQSSDFSTYSAISTSRV
ncbi:uncharacterized protein LOC108896455 [Lates calcarifer]|uniref:Uncharacterized protein LOC108896455 n=1 Tax=Lates calcarifer TaxID=8187 RepID=A0AAJ7VFH8_LATCA|nr:uncharacterized protein LOC108896455 [Lates calcarifer]